MFVGFFQCHASADFAERRGTMREHAAVWTQIGHTKSRSVHRSYLVPSALRILEMLECRRSSLCGASSGLTRRTDPNTCSRGCCAAARQWQSAAELRAREYFAALNGGQLPTIRQAPVSH